MDIFCGTFPTTSDLLRIAWHTYLPALPLTSDLQRDIQQNGTSLFPSPPNDSLKMPHSPLFSVLYGSYKKLIISNWSCWTSSCFDARTRLINVEREHFTNGRIRNVTKSVWNISTKLQYYILHRCFRNQCMHPFGLVRECSLSWKMDPIDQTKVLFAVQASISCSTMDSGGIHRPECRLVLRNPQYGECPTIIISLIIYVFSEDK